MFKYCFVSNVEEDKGGGGAVQAKTLPSSPLRLPEATQLEQSPSARLETLVATSLCR